MTTARQWPAGERKKQPVKVGGVVIGWVTREKPGRYVPRYAATDEALGYAPDQATGVNMVLTEYNRRCERQNRKVQRP